ncbi:MAG: phosphopentomutase [Pseudomonadota bacterium]
MKRAIVIVLDSFGVGASDDAERFGDVGANTYRSVSESRRESGHALLIPELTRLGLQHAAAAADPRVGPPPPTSVDGAWGYAAELSSGKDTPSGHWELAGVPVLFDWGYFSDRENSFPETLLATLIERGELPGILGNCHASGTTIIAELGEEHRRSGKPIVYTSADSVLQIACHEESFGLQRLYQLCELARELVDDYNVGRVIARPFVGTPSTGFVRTGNRRDLTVPPPSETVLDKLVAAGGTVISVGKIADIFAHQGISQTVKAVGNDALMAATSEALASADDRTLVFTNLVDFDMLYGHRRDTAGYAAALERFDQQLGELRRQLRPDDLLVLCADHGCDPEWPGSDHTREYIPVIAAGNAVSAGPLGRRSSFADVGQSLAEYFGLEPMDYGQSFLVP